MELAGALWAVHQFGLLAHKGPTTVVQPTGALTSSREGSPDESP